MTDTRKRAPAKKQSPIVKATAKAAPKKAAPKKATTKRRGAPKNNQFWKQRATHGRDKIFEHPDHLWDSACEYFEWCDSNPLISVEYLGKNASMRKIPKMRAYTWSGLENFLDIYSLRDYRTNEKYKDFSQIITRIEAIIYTQKFEGAAAGLLNSNIIARDLSLTDKSEHKHSGGILTGQMTPEEERAIAERLEKDL